MSKTPRISSYLSAFLSDRERMLDMMVRNIDGLFYCCLADEHWTMLFISDACLKLTGYTAKDLIFNNRLSYDAMTLSEDRALVRQAIDAAVARNSHFDVEYRICRADGEIRWVWERGSPLYNEQGEVEAIVGFIQDINLQKTAKQALLDAEERYRSIFEHAIEGIFQTSSSGQYLRVNPSLAKIYGYASPDELIQCLNNIQQQLYVDPGRRDEFVLAMTTYGVVHNFESQVYKKDGRIIWISENARCVRDSENELLYFEGSVKEITDSKNYAQQIQYQATHDDLTGLPNRSLLSDRMQHCMNFAERYGCKMAVAFVDLDQFKLVNDSMGHHIGDQLLINMARRLVGCIRESDIVLRLGGDEFVVLLTNIHKVEDITHSMQRILASIAEPCVIDKMEFVVSCSIGIGLYPDDGKDPSTLLKHSDSAMYKAKQNGRNNFQFFTPDLNHLLIERLDIEHRLRRAIENDEFVLHYQPKVDFDSNEIIGVEALIRWQPPGESLIPPFKFIQIAEESGMIESIGSWVLLTACQKACEWKKFFGRSLSVAVNVSPRQFRQAGLVGMVQKVLADTGLDPTCLEIEITEGTLADHPEKFIETLHELKSLGIKLSIDDFGTGYSSMAYLKDFPVDHLKIDKAFVGNLENEPTNIAILKAIIALGHSFGMKVIAEGVETAYQHEHLRKLGCDELQGYYFSKPLSVDKFESMITPL